MDTTSHGSQLRTHRDRPGEHRTPLIRPQVHSRSNSFDSRSECGRRDRPQTYAASLSVGWRAFTNRNGELFSYVCCLNLLPASRPRWGIDADCRIRPKNPFRARSQCFRRQVSDAPLHPPSPSCSRLTRLLPDRFPDLRCTSLSTRLLPTLHMLCCREVCPHGIQNLSMASNCRSACNCVRFANVRCRLSC